MKTEELVATLSKDLEAAHSAAPRRTLLVAGAAGMVVSLAILLLWLGAQPLGQAMARASFWMKAAYALALGAAGWIATRRMVRPDGRLGLAALAAPGVFGLLAIVAAAQMAAADSGSHLPLLLGRSWARCPWLILALSTPILFILLIAMRRLAPTRLATAGAATGLLAGGLGATIYGLHCPETSAAFVTIWYSLGIGLSAVLGALVAPRLLRW